MARAGPFPPAHCRSSLSLAWGGLMSPPTQALLRPGSNSPLLGDLFPCTLSPPRRPVPARTHTHTYTHKGYRTQGYLGITLFTCLGKVRVLLPMSRARGPPPCPDSHPPPGPLRVSASYLTHKTRRRWEREEGRGLSLCPAASDHCSLSPLHPGRARSPCLRKPHTRQPDPESTLFVVPTPTPGLGA